MKILRNYLYNVWYQVLAVILPFITIPYVSRVLGVSNIGIVSFTTANTQYFILLASMGITMYATREVAYLSADIKRLKKFFYEIMAIKTFLTLISVILFLFVIFFMSSKYQILYYIQLINVVSVWFDISWFFMGLQNFKVTVIKNALVKVISAILIFTFVNNGDDIYIYMIILGLSTLIGNLTMWPYLKIGILNEQIKIKPLKHLKPLMILFVPQIAIQIFTVLNKTILGLTSNSVELGLFENADKLIRLLTSLVTASGTVLLPAVSELFKVNNMTKVKDFLSKGFKYTSFIVLPIITGAMVLGEKFGLWFFGNTFKGIGEVIIILAPTLLFMAWNNVISSQYLIPAKKESIYTKSFIIGAIANVLLNLLFDFKLGAMGSGIAALISEFIVVSYQIKKIKKFFQIQSIFFDILKYFIASGIMFAFLFVFNEMFLFNGLIFFAEIVIGGIVYLSMIVILKSDMYNEFLRMLNVRRGKSE